MLQRDDLPILCQRFTTSKLKHFEDLMAIGTYGFRGEALASISHIAHLRVTTRTASSSCAWQAHFADGKLTPPKPGQSVDPKPTAGRGGTQITVEDLFYNVPSRRRAFRSPSEEYSKVLEVVTRYAVHCSHVAFSIKKHGESGAGFAVPVAATIHDRIKQAYGASVAKELVAFGVQDDEWGFKVSGFASTANYNAKRTMLLLFINHRLVESSVVKKAIEHTYQMFLPKGGRPFVYMDLEIDPGRVDVNVHPTKREVAFLNEDEIVSIVCSTIRDKLTQVDTTRTFKTQTLLPGVVPMTPSNSRELVDNTELSSGPQSTPRPSANRKPYENNLIRTDSKARKITSMLAPTLSSRGSLDDAHHPGEGPVYVTTDRVQTQIRLTSVKNLRAEVRDAVHQVLTEVFASLTYVGLVDANQRIVALQSGVKLYLVDYGLACSEFFYQVGLTDFGNFGLIQLRPSLPLKDLLEVAADLEVDTSPDCASLDKAEVVNKVYEQIMSRKAMLREYFSIEISEAGELEAIPMLLKGYIPCMAKLPTFLLRLGPFVNWKEEQACFKSFLEELASFYVPERLPRNDTDVGEGSVPGEKQQKLDRRLENVIFPALRSRIVATQRMLNGVRQVASLKELYRVFERC
jgi:DNA mismatch repair protein MLH1